MTPVRVLDNYCVVAAAVMVVHDWIITVPREGRLFCKGKAGTLSALLYFSNRYINLLGQVLSLFPYASLSTKVFPSIIPKERHPTDQMSARGVQPIIDDNVRYHQLYRDRRSNETISMLGITAASTQNWTLSGLVLMLLLCPVATNLMELGYHPTGVIHQILGCWLNDDLPLSLEEKWIIINRACTIAADTLLIAITWYDLSGRTMKKAAMVLKDKDIVGVVLRDGTLYFILFSTNSLLMANPMMSSPSSLPLRVESSSPRSTRLTSILVSHFMLDLQEAYQKKDFGITADNSQYASQSISLGSFNVAPVLGSLAAHIDPFTWDVSALQSVETGETESTASITLYAASPNSGGIEQIRAPRHFIRNTEEIPHEDGRVLEV
ncbi:hypothetical protein DICSQDRAFT_128271 [Dichomitus squalens LYAD-421 SS1]|uniref:DUF6533 domain-containing protein n=1 Tax=Dichomitus squalens (strain LYAD-421) TaxID=732165 RepID=R7ST53_DICSQ|nr:uncharacterized protein DICSQDRAFT_128271 [Dichomitus squalens LYAD-421 SS1]EJF59404.1 hypothetical protein DICSQDRAFT_128271 [Dichomitus squalens LYAD-421 SS1]